MSKNIKVTIRALLIAALEMCRYHNIDPQFIADVIEEFAREQKASN